MKKDATMKNITTTKAIYVLALVLAIASLGTGLALANGTIALPRQVLR